MTEQDSPGGNLPYAAFSGAPIKSRPASVTAIAIIAIVFGSIGILICLCSIPQLLLSRAGGGGLGSYSVTSNATNTTTNPDGTTTTTTVQSPPGPNPFGGYSQDPAIVVWSVINAFLWIILATIAIWAGVGLLHLKPTARIWIMRYAVADIILGIIGLVMTVAVVQPKMMATMQTAMAQANGPNRTINMGPIVNAAMYIGDFVNFLLLSWPVIVLYVMTRPHVKTAFGDLSHAGSL